MRDQKAENLLNLALATPEPEREKTDELYVGYNREEKTWELMRELVTDDMSVFDVLTYSNLFHNLKAAIKAVATGENHPNVFFKDCAISGEEMMEIVRGRGQDYDAFVVACHSDPNLDLVREITDKPVVGIAEASIKIGAAMGNGYAVISAHPGRPAV